MHVHMTPNAPRGASVPTLHQQRTCRPPNSSLLPAAPMAGRAWPLKPYGGRRVVTPMRFPLARPLLSMPQDQQPSPDGREGPSFVSTPAPPSTSLPPDTAHHSLPSSSPSSSSASLPSSSPSFPPPSSSADTGYEQPPTPSFTPEPEMPHTGVRAMSGAGGVDGSVGGSVDAPSVISRSAAAAAAAAQGQQQQEGQQQQQREQQGEHDSHDKQSLDREILNVAWPMLLTLAADPIAGLVDTAFMGRLGAAQLAGVGVALSIFNTITKMFNVPLLSVTTSAVASALGSSVRAAAAAGKSGAGAAAGGGTAIEEKLGAEAGAEAGAGAAVGEEEQVQSTRRKDTAAAKAQTSLDAVSDAACASIGIAIAVGLVQVLLLSQSSSLLSIWGVEAASPLLVPALDFLTVRCYGAPITVLMLVLQGVFRGLQDTRAPLAATIASNVINVILAPLLIFGVGWGVKGAAIATVAAQFLPCLYLLHLLSRRLNLRLSSAGALTKMIGLIKPTGLLVLRTMAISITYATATSVAARSNMPAAAAAHQVSFQVSMACSLLSDSLSVAAQTLLAASLAAGQPRKARAVASRTLTLGGALGAGLGLALAAGRHHVARAFTADQSVLLFMAGLMPLVALGQPFNTTAMTLDGIVFGAGGFAFACMVSAAAALPAWVCMAVADASASASTRLLWVWVGLLSLMAVRAGALGLAFSRGTGPFSRMPPAPPVRPKLA